MNTNPDNRREYRNGIERTTRHRARALRWLDTHATHTDDADLAALIQRALAATELELQR